jgi:signal peptidase II
MRLLGATLIASFLLDQITKYLVLVRLDLAARHEVPVLPPFLQFRMAWNEGVNFGLFPAAHDLGRWLLIGLALAISAWIWAWAARDRTNARLQVGAGMVIGGALGNVVDRIVHGAVADFLNMGLPGFDNPFSFNVADAAIFLGALGLVLFAHPGDQADKTP